MMFAKIENHALCLYYEMEFFGLYYHMVFKVLVLLIMVKTTTILTEAPFNVLKLMQIVREHTDS